MKIIDTHCHYNLDPLVDTWQEHYQNAQTEGVTHSLIVGTTLETSQKAIEIAQEEPTLFASIGYHPYEFIDTAFVAYRNSRDIQLALEDTTATIEDEMTALATLAHPKVLAIGETGLDYFRLNQYTESEKRVIMLTQQEALRAHIKLATARQIPLILHIRDTGEKAYDDVLQVLSQENYVGEFILHCVSGTLTYVKKALEMGAHISVAGNVTYTSAKQLREIVRNTPADRLLIETDAPFLPAMPHRGKVCEPWMIRLTAEYLQKELRVDAEQCYENTLELFPQMR